MPRRTRQGISTATEQPAPQVQQWGLDRVVFPLAGFTKRQVIEYYDGVAPFILPHLKDHPVTLKRYPDEAGGEFFWEKDAPAFTPKWVKTFAVWRRTGESQIHYILINDRRTLLWAASVNTLEIHPFLARVPNIEQPTAIVFDLDPGPPADILQCAQVGFLLRELLARLELQSFAKVSGSKGIQVYVPLNTPATYAVTQPFARTVAELLGREHPALIVADMEKAQRKGKVFIDWSQNADYKTTVGVYSLRAKRRHPYSSMPVEWDDLRRAVERRDPKSLFYSPEAALQRVKGVGDLFAPVLSLKQHVPETFVHDLPGARDAKEIGGRVGTAPTVARVLDMPRASEQGGRRRFVLEQRAAGARLTTEIHGKVRTWELPEGMPGRPGQTSIATEVRTVVDRAEFEKADRAGGTDVGTCELIEGNYSKGYLELYFAGRRLRGEWIFARAAADAAHWTVTRVRRPDFEWPATTDRLGNAPAGPKSGKKAFDAKQPRTSSPKIVVSVGRLDLNKLPSRVPEFITPMECRLVPSAPEGEQWIYELKLDGYRVIATKKNNSAQLFSRYGNSLNQRFPAIAAALEQSSLADVVLDGEIVALDEQGRPSFQELQNTGTIRPIVYYVFDVLNYSRKDLQGVSLEQRKRVLEKIAPGLVEPVRMAATLDSDVRTLVKEIKRLGLEGIVAKRRDSFYESGKRSGAWMKYRLTKREVFVIGGYIPGRNFLDAILVGRFVAGELMFVKRVRNGFVRRTREQVFRAIEPLRIPTCPFANLPEPPDRRGAVDVEEMKKCVWVKPVVKCEVEFVEWTRAGRLRHAAFRRLVERGESSPGTAGRP